MVVHCGPAPAGLLLGAERAGARRAVHRARAAAHAAGARAHRPLLRRRPAVLRGLGARQPPLRGSATTAATWSSSSAAASPSRTRPSRSRTRSGGRSRPTARRSPTRSTRPGSTRRRCASCWRASRARCWSSRATRTALIPADRSAAFAELTGAELVTFEGAGHCIHARDPVRFNHLLRDFAERVYGAPAAGAALAPRADAAQARALRLLADRARARVARRRDRARAAQPAPGPGDRLAGPGPGHARARGVRRAHPSRQRAAGQRVAPHHRSSRASTSSTCSRPGGGWTRSCSPTSWSSTTSCARRSTTCGSATRPGSSTTTCTRTRSSSAPRYCFLTDFVGWLPLPEGGAEEARLTADYNAEMIEQIARFPRVRDRAIFVGSPEDVVPGRRSATGCPRSARGSRSTSTSPATCWRPGRAGRARAPTAASASSPSAARASAAACCGA